MLESDGQVHASSFRSVAASRPLESIASRGRAQCCTRLRIWGSGVSNLFGRANKSLMDMPEKHLGTPISTSRVV